MKTCMLRLLLVFLMTGVLAYSAAAEKVIIYAALDEKTVNELAAAFTEETGSKSKWVCSLNKRAQFQAGLKLKPPIPGRCVYRRELQLPC